MNLKVLQPTKVNRKLFIYSCLITWILILNIGFFIYYYYYDRYASLTSPSFSSEFDEYESQNNWSFEDVNNDNKKEYNPVNTTVLNNLYLQTLQKQLQINDIRDIEPIFSTNYDNILKNHDYDPFSILGNLNFQDRCDLYFQNLYAVNHNWFINPDENLPLVDRLSFDFEDWKQTHMNDMKEKYAKEHKMNKDDVKHDQEFEDFMLSLYKQFWSATKNTEQKVSDYLSHLRIFNKCYIANDNANHIKEQNDFILNQKLLVREVFEVGNTQLKPFTNSKLENSINPNSFHDCNDLEQRLYPWLSFNFPAYEHWSGEVLMSPPQTVTKKKSTPPPIKSKLTNSKSCFLNKFKNLANGKGLVMTINDGHLEDTVNLIRLLRALKNKLPIQIVYYDHISANTKRKIIEAARERFNDLPKSFEKVRHLFGDDYLQSEDQGLPKQDIWFVNTYHVVHGQYREKFRHWGNKFLATLFNSYEEFILLDSDAAIVKNPEIFFELEGYKETGTYFYKDRTTAEYRPVSDSVFFKKISPSVLDSLIFNIPLITTKTTNNHILSGLKHQMESGLVVINRSMHMASLLLMPQLHFMDPAKDRSHGDKELFWLAFSINGDENYHFNKHNAAAIGIIDPARKKKNGDDFESIEICSPHPGHVNGYDNSLDWFNSGFHFCGRYTAVNYPQDFRNRKQTLNYIKSVEEMRTFYYNPVQIEYAILPPFTNSKEMEFPNEEEEPVKAWVKHQEICHGYQYCAFTSAGGKDLNIQGELVEFSETQRLLYQYYGDIWVGLE
ncbi:mannosyltransferase putative-domain-containing protein [Scheffersomyces coipomensis]|uniref:mannosyltransferase putative-domain-containing protein n=1 Tax=Scheffersomyces coipomensis TaxID=1788519 RepID=UPI00315C5D9F